MSTRLLELQDRVFRTMRGHGSRNADWPAMAEGEAICSDVGRSCLRLALVLSMTGVGCQDPGVDAAVFEIQSAEAAAPKLVLSVADHEPVMQRLRIVSRAARQSDVETFKAEVEPLLWDPESIESLMRTVAREGLEYEDQVAVVGFVQLALKSYGASRTTGYYGEDFDPSTFVDLAVFDLLPSVVPDCALALVEQLSESNLLLPKHSWTIVSLASNEDLSDGCHSAMIKAVERGVFEAEVLHDLVQSRADRGQEQSIVFYKAWRALLASGEDASVNVAMNAALEGGFHQAWNHRLLEGFVPLVNSGKVSFDKFMRYIDNRPRVESRSVELMTTVETAESAEVARQIVLGDRGAESRIYYLALASKDSEFIDVVAKTDRSLAVRTWARHFAFLSADSTEGRLDVVEGLLRDIANCNATTDLYSACSRALVVFKLLRESVASRSTSALALKDVETQLRELADQSSMPSLIGDAFRDEAEQLAALIELEEGH